MDSAALKIIGNQELEKIKQSIVHTEGSGQYYIPDITILDGNDKIRLLTWLTMTLSRTFPMYTWKQSENFGQRGILVSWEPIYGWRPSIIHMYDLDPKLVEFMCGTEPSMYDRGTFYDTTRVNCSICKEKMEKTDEDKQNG